MSLSEYRQALAAAWSDFGDPRVIVDVEDTSPRVSTNTVFRVYLDDASHVYAKVSN